MAAIVVVFGVPCGGGGSNMNARARDALKAIVLLTLCVGSARAEEPKEIWSPVVAGLSCRLLVNDNQVPQGAEVPFRLQLRYQPGPGAPVGVTLVRFMEARGVRFTFTDEETGKTFSRIPRDGSGAMLVIPWEDDLIALGAKPLAPVPVPVRLLTRKAEQLPAGRYTVVATYENAGVVEDTLPKPKTSPWKGRLVSPPLRLRVLPAQPRLEEHEVPTRLVLERDEGGIAYSTAAKPLAKIRFTSRPGYVLGSRTTDRIVVGSGEPQDVCAGLGGLPRPESWRSSLPAEVVGRAIAGESLTLWSDLEVFETSIPDEHFWSPESGSYKTLWKGRLEGALAAGERAGWDRPVRGVRCVLTAPAKAHVPGRPFPVTLLLRSASDAQVELWSSIFHESLVTLAPDGSFHQMRLTNDPDRKREKALVIKKGSAHRITKDVSAFLDTASAKQGGKLRLIWHAWLICGDPDDVSTLHISNAVEVETRSVPGK